MGNQSPASTNASKSASDKKLTRATVTNRVIAKMIDLVLMMLLAAVVVYPVGPILGFFYSIAADGLNFGGFRGQSLGKKIMRLRVLHVTQGRPARVRESLLRNAPVGVVTFFSIIPVWGWLILALLGIPLLMMEVYLMLSVGNGHRLGDVMGDTEVVQLGAA